MVLLVSRGAVVISPRISKTAFFIMEARHFTRDAEAEFLTALKLSLRVN
jgi:hypothetical protein